MTSSRTAHRVGTLLMVLVCLGIIAAAVSAVLQRPCRVDGVVPVAWNSDCPPVAEDLAPLAVAFGICIIILVMELIDAQASVMEFVVVAGILATGKLALTGSDVAFRLNYLMLAWISPFFFRLHVRLVGGVRAGWGRRLMFAFFALAALWSVPVVLWNAATLREISWFDVWRSAVRLTPSLAVVSSLIIVVWHLNAQRTGAGRRPIRLIVFGNLAALAPMLLLSLIPEGLGVEHFVPYELTFLGLLINPLLYAYAMLPYRTTRLDAFLRRGAVYYLLVTFVAGIFLVSTALLHRLANDPAEQWPLMSIAVGTAVLTIMDPLQRRLAQLTDWVWYGGSASYSGVVGHLSESLSTTLDRTALERILVTDLAGAMNLSWSALYMRASEQTLVKARCHGAAPDGLATELPATGALARHLEAHAEPLSHQDLIATMAAIRLDPSEQALISVGGIERWLPLISAGVLHGVLLVGPKAADDFFTPQDHDILATMAHQSGIAAHNVRLMAQVSAGRHELARAHRQLLEAGEQERRRLAQELHDGAVQQLIGISYQLAATHRRTGSNSDGAESTVALRATLETTRQEVLDVATQLRGMIGELRPAGLEELGLSAALHGYVSRLRREFEDEAPEIELDLGEVGTPVPIPIALCLFRVAQEGMRNAIKHAGASHVTLRLSRQENQLALTVRDDGCGFAVPQRLSELAAHNHFGLVSMSERVAQAGGTLSIRSEPGAGAEIIVHITLAQEADDGQITDQGVTGGRSPSGASGDPGDAMR